MSICRCPHCGGPIELSAVKRSQPATRRGGIVFRSSNRSIFKSDAAAPVLPQNYTAERIAPAFLPSRESHVTVPLLRSLITGAFFGITAGVVTSWLYISGKGGVWYSIELGVMVGAVVFFGSSFFYWLYITGQYDGLLSRVETVTGLDINQDGEIGKPEPRTVRVEVATQAGRQIDDLPGDEAALIEFAKDIVSNRVTFSERGAIKSGYGSDNFRLLRDVFIKRNWARWKDDKNRQQGVDLYQAGKLILRDVAKTQLADDDDLGMSNQTVTRGTNSGTLT